MDVLCHGCKTVAGPDDEKCRHCGYILVRRADLTIWSRTRPICIIAIVAFVLFCFISSRAHWTQNNCIAVLVAVGVPLLFTGWLLRTSAPEWMHPLTYNEISSAVGLGLGLPLAAVFMHVRGARPELQITPSTHTQRPSAASGNAAAPGTATITPAPTSESDILLNQLAKLVATLPAAADDTRAEFENIAGLRKMLYTASLEDTKRIKTSRQRIQRLDGRLNEVDTARRSALADFPARVNASAALSTSAKADVLSRARIAAGPPVKAWTQFITLQRRLLQETDATLAFVASLGGDRYKVVGGKLQFARPKDDADFTQRQKKLADLWQQMDDQMRVLRTSADTAARQLNANPATKPPPAPAFADTDATAPAVKPLPYIPMPPRLSRIE